MAELTILNWKFFEKRDEMLIKSPNQNQTTTLQINTHTHTNHSLYIICKCRWVSLKSYVHFDRYYFDIDLFFSKMHSIYRNLELHISSCQLYIFSSYNDQTNLDTLINIQPKKNFINIISKNSHIFTNSLSPHYLLHIYLPTISFNRIYFYYKPLIIIYEKKHNTQ